MVGESLSRVAPAVGLRLRETNRSEDISLAKEPHFLFNLSKRLVDVLVAGVLLIATLPLMFVACAAILLTTGGAPVLAQRRVGRLGREFTMYKLRTMRCREQPAGGLAAKPAHDERVTAVGRVLRRTSIDELPQFLNVLAGQMSLVGPRPSLPAEVAAYRPSWRRRLAVTPGLTGLWQVSGRSSLPPERWMALDRFYLRQRSLGFDLLILARTVAAVVSMRGAW
jgi:lipopolysaccharide/colanic/teichoic acid biosynthesis glycosyltransferase